MVYPNPFINTFRLNVEQFEGVSATLIDISGRVISPSIKLEGSTTEFDLTGIKDRMLFLHLDKPDGSVTLRILRED